MKRYNVIVIGAGIAGASTIYQLSKSHKNVAIFEQFEFGHEHGSSHGASRIYRMCYDDEVYSRMGIRALEKWKSVEKEANTQVLHQIGGIDFGYKQHMNKIVDVCQKNNIPHERLETPEDFEKRLPYINPGKNYVGILQKDAGILNATHAVKTLLWLASKQGADLYSKTQIVDIQQKGTGYQLRTKDGSIYETEKLVICAGAWTRAIIEKFCPSIELNLQAVQMSYCSWKVEKEYLEAYRKGVIFIHWGPYKDGEESLPKPSKEAGHTHQEGRSLLDLGFYGFPIFEPESGLFHFKASAHYSLKDDILTHQKDPCRDRTYAMTNQKIEDIKKFLKTRFKGVDTTKPVKMKTCLYTWSHDENFIIDTIPGHPNISMFGAGSGHAFKFGVVIGEMMKQLVETPHCSTLCDEFPRSKFALMNQATTRSKL